MILDFSSIKHDFYGNVEKPVLTLKSPDGRVISTISSHFGLKAIFRYNDVSEVDFSLPAFFDGNVNKCYENVSGMRLVEVEPFGDFILSNIEIKNEGGRKEVKNCKAYSLEYAFNYKKAEIPAGTYNFYNPVDNSDTIITMIHEFVPDWSIGEIDRELIGRWRTFDNVDDNLYSFMMNTLQESYNCLFLFDTFNKKINVISAKNAPSKLPIYLSYNNLLKSVNITELSDEVITALSGYGSGDEVNIRSVNPNGTNTIYNLDYFIARGDLPQDLADKWVMYDDSLALYRQVFSNLNVLYVQKLNEKMLAEAKAAVSKTEYDALNTAYLTAQTTNGQNAEYDEEIANLKSQLEVKNGELTVQKSRIDILKAELETIDKQISDVVSICKITSYFSEDEVKILTQYFKQDSIAEETFVIPEYSSAILESSSNTLDASNLGNVKIVGSEIYASNIAEVFSTDENGEYQVNTINEDGEQTYNAADLSVFHDIIMPDDIAETVVNQLNDEAKRKVYEFRGGTFEFNEKITENGSIVDVNLKGDVVNVDFHYNVDNLNSYVDDTSPDITKAQFFMLTAVLRNATYRGTLYPSLNISMQGMLLRETPQIGESFVGFDIQSAVIYTTASITEYQKQAVVQELYDYVSESLEKLAQPSYEFSVESGNFVFAKEFEQFKDRLKLGSTINLALDDNEENIIQPILIELTLNYDDESDFSITFSNKYRSSKSEFQISDLIKDMSHVTHSVSLNKASYSAYKDSKAINQIEKLTTSELDVARNNIINSANQGFEFNSTGMFLRKTLTNGTYSPEQIGFINNLIAFTNDDWDTVKLAIGHFNDINIGDTWGIVAPNITGTLLAGENLVIENTVLGENGTDIIKQFKVDSTGAWLNNAAFCLSQDPDIDAGTAGGKILIDPTYGIAAGDIDMFTLNGTTVSPAFKDENGDIIWDETKSIETESGTRYYVPNHTKFFFDIQTGDAYFGGDINAENVITGTLNGSAIVEGSIDAGSKLTGDVDADQIYKNVVSAINQYVEFSEDDGMPVVGIDTAVIQNLSAQNFVGGSIVADSVDAASVTGDLIAAINATISDAVIDKAKIGVLDANQVNITNGYITNAMIESLSASKINTGYLSSDYLQIADGFITNAMIESLNANKILAGSIYTNLVDVQSEDGGLTISGNTIQWRDTDDVIRMQAGRDANNDFTFAVFGTDGTTTYFDETGIKSAAVPDGLIVDNMVANGANISAGKLDIQSLFYEINNDGSNTIDVGKIYYDDQNQSLSSFLSSVQTGSSSGRILIGGKCLYGDPIFTTDVNEIVAYDVSGNEVVTITRQAKSADNPLLSDYELLVSTAGTASPGLGGFGWGHDSRANASFVYRIIAKIPIGYTLEFADSNTGTDGGYAQNWMTSKDGTGYYSEYLYQSTCGETGTFDTTGYFYLSGTPTATAEAPVMWNIAYATVYDMTDVGVPDIEDYVSKEIITATSEITQTTEEITMRILSGYTTAEDLEEYKDQIENTFSINEEGFEAKFTQLTSRLNEVGGELVERNQFIRLVGGNIVIGKSDSPVTTVITNSAVEFRYNDNPVAKFTNEVLEVHNIKVENQIAYGTSWATRPGNYIEGRGYNLNDVWIGG